MYIGTDGKWGFTFKSDSGIGADKQAVIGSVLARFDGLKCFFKSARYEMDNQKFYLPPDIQIIGIAHAYSDPITIGIIWLPSNKAPEEVFYCADIESEYCNFPYKVGKDKSFYVLDGEVYVCSKPGT